MKSFRNIIGFFVFLIIYSCSSIPDETLNNSKRLNTGFGPEDMVLDIDSSSARILTGCEPRREGENIPSDIYYYDINIDEIGILKRIGEPKDFEFHPHGMDLITLNSVKLLYVINHRDDIGKHDVLRYRLLKDTLVFDKMFESNLYISPNDICVYKDGSFWITNDSGKRHSMLERTLKLKRSTIIYTNTKAESKIVADNLAYANGITYKDKNLYISTTMQSTVFSYEIDDGNLNNRTEICKIKGGDNLTWAGNDLIVTGHLDFLAFMKHVKDSASISPSVVYKIDLQTGNKSVIYSNKGDHISAASTAILLDDNLYISQVFNPFILKVALK